MTRRSGIIAALTAMFIETIPAQSVTTTISNTWTIHLDPLAYTGGREIDYEASKKLPPESGMVVVKAPPPPAPFLLKIVYGKRTITLTPEEIMDALEGKPYITNAGGK